MLRTKKATAGQPESVARADLLGQFPVSDGVWKRDASRIMSFQFSNEKMHYKRKKQLRVLARREQLSHNPALDVYRCFDAVD